VDLETREAQLPSCVCGSSMDAAAACLSHPPLKERQRTPRLHALDCATVPQDDKQGSQKAAKKHFAFSTAGAQQEPGDSFLSSHHASSPKTTESTDMGIVKIIARSLPPPPHIPKAAVPIQTPTLVYKGRA
jgi:hypothetical protein